MGIDSKFAWIYTKFQAAAKMLTWMKESRKEKGYTHVIQIISAFDRKEVLFGLFLYFPDKDLAESAFNNMPKFEGKEWYIVLLLRIINGNYRDRVLIKTRYIGSHQSLGEYIKAIFETIEEYSHSSALSNDP